MKNDMLYEIQYKIIIPQKIICVKRFSEIFKKYTQCISFYILSILFMLLIEKGSEFICQKKLNGCI